MKNMTVPARAESGRERPGTRAADVVAILGVVIALCILWFVTPII